MDANYDARGFTARTSRHSLTTFGWRGRHLWMRRNSHRELRATRSAIDEREIACRQSRYPSMLSVGRSAVGAWYTMIPHVMERLT
jgi:hypothetical protein